MKKTEAIKFLNKQVKIILKNGFHFTGKVISLGEESLEMIDKFNQNVSINLEEIIICSEARE